MPLYSNTAEEQTEQFCPVIELMWIRRFAWVWRSMDSWLVIAWLLFRVFTSTLTPKGAGSPGQPMTLLKFVWKEHFARLMGSLARPLLFRLFSRSALQRCLKNESRLSKNSFENSSPGQRESGKEAAILPVPDVKFQ